MISQEEFDSLTDEEKLSFLRQHERYVRGLKLELEKKLEANRIQERGTQEVARKTDLFQSGSRFMENLQRAQKNKRQ